MLDVALLTSDDRIAEKVRRALSFSRANVDRLSCPPCMRNVFIDKQCDLVVLHTSNLDCCHQCADLEYLGQLREATPTIAIVTDEQATKAFHLLDAGVDRFMVESFDEKHFGAVARALVRRRQGRVSSVSHYGHLCFDHDLKQLRVRGEVVELTTRESQVLDVLLRRIGQIISKEEFVQEIDPDNLDLNFSAVEVYIHRIRKKISSDVLPIRNIKRCGYYLRRFSPT